MRPEDFQRFNAVMNGMAKLYERDLDAPLLDAYWLALREWPLDAFENAAAHLMGKAKFMPRPSEFNELRKAQKPVAAEAWLKARWSCGTAYTPNGYVGGTSGDPLIDKAVAVIGGYGAIAMCDESKLHFLERRFKEVYESIEDAQEVRQALPQLGNGTFSLAALNKQSEQRKLMASNE